VRAGALGAAAFSLSLLLLAAAPGRAQTVPPPPPLPGFVPPYEIAKIVRSAGFDPLAPPLREGTTYVVRATDFRGILMRVVVDAHSGAIRAVNRIVAGPPYGPIGMLPPSYEVPSSYGVPPDYAPPEFRGLATAPNEENTAPPAPFPAAVRAVIHPFVAEPPPLPRPRPAELALRDAKTGTKSGETAVAKPDAKSNATVTPPSAASVAPKIPTPAAPMNE
jgi:hypothetical protein